MRARSCADLRRILPRSDQMQLNAAFFKFRLLALLVRRILFEIFLIARDLIIAEQLFAFPALSAHDAEHPQLIAEFDPLFVQLRGHTLTPRRRKYFLKQPILTAHILDMSAHLIRCKPAQANEL